MIKKSHKSILGLWKFIKFIKTQNYQKIISPHRSFRTSLIVYFSKVKERIGFNTSSLSFVYSKKISYDKSAHEVERNLSLLKVFQKFLIGKLNPI